MCQNSRYLINLQRNKDLFHYKVGGQNTLRPPTSKSRGTCPPVHPMIDAHGRHLDAIRLVGVAIRNMRQYATNQMLILKPILKL